MEMIVSSCMCMCVSVCGWMWDWELKRLNDPSDIYVFYYGEGGGIKSPDPECCVCYCRLPPYQCTIYIDNRTQCYCEHIS